MTRALGISGALLAICVGVSGAAGGTPAPGPRATNATGSGNVFAKDWRDGVSTASLPRLGALDSLFGENVAIIQNGLVSPIAHDPAGQYFYTPASPSSPDPTHFDEVNVYYHVDRFYHDFIGAHCGVLLAFNAPWVRVNYPVGVALTGYSTEQQLSYMLFDGPTASFSRDPAKDSDIIYHEATHALLYGFDFGTPSPGGETAAIHEGTADYFACAFNEDPHFGEATYISWPGGVDSMTTSPKLFNYAHYGLLQMGPSSGESHSNGAIWAGALWDIRTSLGAVADSLAAEMFFYLASTANFVQAAYGYLQADLDIHGGRDVATIINKFVGRGINIGMVGVDMTGPVGGPETRLAVSPNPMGGTGRVTFGLARSGPVRVEVFDLNGRRISVLADGVLGAGPQHVAWETGSLRAGLYVVRLSTSGRQEAVRAVLVR